MKFDKLATYFVAIIIFIVTWLIILKYLFNYLFGLGMRSSYYLDIISKNSTHKFLNNFVTNTNYMRPLILKAQYTPDDTLILKITDIISYKYILFVLFLSILFYFILHYIFKYLKNINFLKFIFNAVLSILVLVAIIGIYNILQEANIPDSIAIISLGLTPILGTIIFKPEKITFKNKNSLYLTPNNLEYVLQKHILSGDFFFRDIKINNIYYNNELILTDKIIFEYYNIFFDKEIRYKYYFQNIYFENSIFKIIYNKNKYKIFYIFLFIDSKVEGKKLSIKNNQDFLKQSENILKKYQVDIDLYSNEELKEYLESLDLMEQYLNECSKISYKYVTKLPTRKQYNLKLNTERYFKMYMLGIILSYFLLFIMSLFNIHYYNLLEIPLIIVLLYFLYFFIRSQIIDEFITVHKIIENSFLFIKNKLYRLYLRGKDTEDYSYHNDRTYISVIIPPNKLLKYRGINAIHYFITSLLTSILFSILCEAALIPSAKSIDFLIFLILILIVNWYHIYYFLRWYYEKITRNNFKKYLLKQKIDISPKYTNAKKEDIIYYLYLCILKFKPRDFVHTKIYYGRTIFIFNILTSTIFIITTFIILIM